MQSQQMTLTKKPRRRKARHGAKVTADLRDRKLIELLQEDASQNSVKLAKRLGIKPGSPEFHALKRGHDLYANGSTTKKGKNNTKGNGKGNPNKRN